ncbi:MAG: mechanosensitive ion channel [Clostridia bacterium]|nr:mechanosensitive ion channel [Clostridia bacterium]
MILLASEGSAAERVLKTIGDIGIKYGLKLLAAVAVIVVGLWLTKLAVKLLERSKWFGKIDRDARAFVKSAIKIALTVMVIVTAIAIMGVPMASIVAVIASCGVAIGLALQGSLSNFAGGLMLVLFKPFRVGDYIQANGQEGTVEEIGVFSTKLITVDNRQVVMPNAGLSNSVLVNATHFDERRVDIFFRVDPDADSDAVVSALRLAAEAQAKRDPVKPVETRLDSYGESFVKYHVKVWCKTSDYWELYYSLAEDCKRALQENGIRFSVQQVEMRK